MEPIKSENESLRKMIEHQMNQIKHLNEKCDRSIERTIRVEAYSMRENIIISGMVEEKEESETDLRVSVTKLFTEDMQVDMTNTRLLACHRMRGNQTPRDIIVGFDNHSGKKAAMKNAYHLKKRTTPT